MAATEALAEREEVSEATDDDEARMGLSGVDLVGRAIGGAIGSRKNPATST